MRARGQKGVSSNTATTFLGAVKSFYKSNGFELNYKVPKPTRKKENIKKPLDPSHIQRLLNMTDSLRDKAFFVTQYESLQSIKEIVNLNYGDIKSEFEKGIVPVHLHLVRGKSNTEYDTFIGKDAISLLKSYLNERKRKGEVLTHYTPLFINESTKKYDSKRRVRRVTRNNISTIVRNNARALMSI